MVALIMINLGFYGIKGEYLIEIGRVRGGGENGNEIPEYET